MAKSRGKITKFSFSKEKRMTGKVGNASTYENTTEDGKTTQPKKAQLGSSTTK